MKRLRRFNDKDETANEIAIIQEKIRKLKSKEYLSEYEYSTLELLQSKLNYLRRQ